VAPMTAAAEDKPLMDGGGMESYRLRDVKRYGEVLWLNYLRK